MCLYKSFLASYICPVFTHIQCILQFAYFPVSSLKILIIALLPTMLAVDCSLARLRLGHICYLCSFLASTAVIPASHCVYNVSRESLWWLPVSLSLTVNGCNFKENFRGFCWLLCGFSAFPSGHQLVSAYVCWVSARLNTAYIIWIYSAFCNFLTIS